MDAKQSAVKKENRNKAISPAAVCKNLAKAIA